MSLAVSERSGGALRMLCLTFVALTLGLSFAHVLELVGKLRLSGSEWLVVQHNLYVAFGPVGGTIEVAAIALTWIHLARQPRGTRARRWIMAAAVAVSVGLAEWALVVAPMNGVLNGWRPASMPLDWTRVRDRWELGHAVQTVLFLFGFCALLVAGDRPRQPDGGTRPESRGDQ